MQGIAIEIAFQKKIGAGLFGGEGFIMQRLVGDGLAFVHAGGTIIKKELQAGEMIKLDTGCLVAMTTTIEYDVQFAGNLKSAIFGGEGLFLATLRGPGLVWLQSLPFSRLANRMHAASRRGGGDSKGEGGLFGGIGVKNLLGRD
ncbi:MAG: AIM24 family protein [Clostridia bacterium]|nr:AIM24 family protein [Clostridia bacterium]